MTHITTLKVRNKTFEIVHDEKGFWAIEDKYFTNGKLNKQINGFTGHLSETLDQCIERAKLSAEVDYLINVKGYDKMEAIEKAVFGEKP